jgi:V-type H+-transporting ATPase subunit D
MSKQVVPSRMNLGLFKQKIIGARKGHELLKKKCDALKTRFRVVMINLLDTKKSMGTEAQEALLLFAKAQWAAGEFHQNVKDSVKRASIRIELSSDNIAGVQLPVMHLKDTEELDSNINQIGIARGGQTIQRCREKFKELLLLLVQIASHQTSFMTLDEVIKVTNRRVNALEHLVIPSFIVTVNYIQQELDEQSREDYYRLKKVLDNKKRMIAEEEAIKAQTLREQRAADGIAEENEEEDPDLIF